MDVLVKISWVRLPCESQDGKVNLVSFSGVMNYAVYDKNQLLCQVICF